MNAKHNEQYAAELAPPRTSRGHFGDRLRREWEPELGPSGGGTSFCAQARAAYLELQLYGPRDVLERHATSPPVAHLPSLRHVPTQWGVRTGRRTTPTPQSLLSFPDPVAEADACAVEEAVRCRKYLRYGAYLREGEEEGEVG